MKQKISPKQIADVLCLRLIGHIDNELTAETQSLTGRSLIELVRLSQTFTEKNRRKSGYDPKSDFDQVRAEFSFGGGVFSSGFSAALGQTAKAFYDQSPANWRRWANFAEVATLTGTRIVVDPSGSPALVPAGQGYPKSGSAGRTASSTLKKYGKIIGITFEAILADDLELIKKLVREEVNVAIRLEDDLAITELTTASSFFLAANGNKLTGSALTSGNLATAITTLRTLTTKTKPDVQLRNKPAVLLAPAALEHTAKGLIPYDRLVTDGEKIELVVDSRLDEDSATSWYLVTDHKQIDSIVLQFLKGQTEPELLELPKKLEFDGERYRIKHTAAAKASQPFGIIKSEA